MSERKGKLLLIREQEATPEIAVLYHQIKTALGLPHVNLIFQAYAAIPGYLRVVWEQFQPVFAESKFFELADRLRGEAYTRAHNYFAVPDICEELDVLSFSDGAKHELTDVIELFHYNNPLLLLICSAQLAAFEQPIQADVPASPLAKLMKFPNRPVLVEERTAPTPTRKIYEEMKRLMNIPVVNTDYRAFARWPDFLRTYWAFLRPTLQSPLYLDQQNELRESASALVKEIPGELDFTAERLVLGGIDEDDIATAVRVNELFERILSGLVINIAIAKIGVEGGIARPEEMGSSGEPRQAA